MEFDAGEAKPVVRGSKIWPVMILAHNEERHIGAERDDAYVNGPHVCLVWIGRLGRIAAEPGRKRP